MWLSSTFFATLAHKSCDLRAGAAKVYFLYYACTAKFWLPSQSCHSVLPLLRLYWEVVTSEPELPKCAVFTALVGKSCGFRAGAAEVYFLCYTSTDRLRLSSRSCHGVLLYYTGTEKLRLSSRSCHSVLPLLYLYWKVATSEPELPKCASFSTLVLKSCGFRAGAAKVYLFYYTCPELWRLSSRSCQSVLPLLYWCRKLWLLSWQSVLRAVVNR